MKVLFLFPPQWMPIAPHFAIATLMGQFENTSYEASMMDLNIDFYNKILTRNYVSNALKRAKTKLEETKAEIKTIYQKGKKFEEYTFEQKNKIAKSSMLLNMFQKYGKQLDKTPILVEQSVEILKSNQHFYLPKLFVNAINTINTALEICSAPYFPTKLGYVSFSNELMKLDYETIKYYVFDKETNIFRDYFETVIGDILKQNADYIGISINSSNQIIAGLTLANMLKKRTKAHVNIGGNHFGRVADALEKYPEFFELFCDSLSLEEGEIPVYKLAQHINGEINVEEVPNLMYVKDGKVCKNPIIEPLKLNDMKMASLKGYDLKAYFTPEIVMPFQTSRGCYWRKCSFCDHDFGMCYNIKNLDKLIEEIKYFKENYGITKFEFIDEAISPAYMETMCKRFIEEKLDIEFFCDARLETGFSKEILELAARAGLKMVLWGYESGSRKIMDLINKGIDVDNRLNILRDSRNAGIFNFAFIFFGFPAETKEDAMMTINEICANTDIINTYGKSMFTMGKHTKLREAPEKYGVVGETYQEAEFSPTYVYEAIGMSKKELNEMMDLCTKRANEAYGNALVFHLLSREIILLYLCKYGVDTLCNYKFEDVK
ncbi:MAG: B12-binding domain-containing radical SAM protein [Cyanobacteria bacterium SIG27]|nr:B12-binding domain-containing radical SAM protein [Cyanobacteria bacterium SIG27]